MSVTFTLEVNEETYEEDCDDFYSSMLKYFEYLKCIKTRKEWLASQDEELVSDYLKWFVRPSSSEDPEIRNYELAFMAAVIYSHKIINQRQMADLFISRFSRFKGYVDSGAAFEEAIQKDLSDAATFEPSIELLKLQGRAFPSIGNDMMTTAYMFMEQYAHLYNEDTAVFKLVMTSLFSAFDPAWRALFTDSSKMIVFEFDRSSPSDYIPYVPDPHEDFESNEKIYVLSVPNLVANTLDWYDGDIPIDANDFEIGDEDEEDD